MLDPLPQPQKALPHSEESERAVLAAVLIHPPLLATVSGRLTPEDFYVERHGLIYQAMLFLQEESVEVDLRTLQAKLEQRDQLDAVGGVAYLAGLDVDLPDLGRLESYVDIVKERSVRRRLIDAATRTIRNSLDGGLPAQEALGLAEQAILSLGEETVRRGFVPLGDVLHEAIEEIEERPGKALTGLPTGFVELDAMTRGLNPGNLIILAGRPGMGKCLARESEIVLDDGSITTIEELYRRRKGHVSTLLPSLRIASTVPSGYLDDGRKPVFEVVTRLGRRVRTTLPHPFRTLDGWRPLSDLRAGDHIAVPRSLPKFGDRRMRDCEVRLLAYLIGDGGLTRSTVSFTNANPAIHRDFADAVQGFGGVIANVRDPGARTPSSFIILDHGQTAAARSAFAAKLDDAIEASGRTMRSIAQTASVSPVSVLQWRRGHCMPGQEKLERLSRALEIEVETLAGEDPTQARRHRPNPLRSWLAELGLDGCGAHDKTIPTPVFQLPREQIVLFLNRLFATDGWAAVLASGQVQIGYASVSERLAQQVQHLLLRLGVLAKLRRRLVRYRDTRRVSWQLDITHGESIRRFVDEIGIFGKEDAIERVRQVLRNRRRHANTDLIPVEVWHELERQKGGMSWAELARKAGVPSSNIHAHRRAISRHRLARFALVLQSDRLRDLARSDVYWDRIESITPVGTDQVYDLSIPDTQNFIANDVCVHNTSLAVNMAQYAAIHEGKPVGIFSLEMGSAELARRILASEADIPSHALVSGHMSKNQWQKVVRTARRIDQAPLMIDDSANPTLLEIASKARRLRAERGLELIIVDYLQLMQAGGRYENRNLELGAISRGLKQLAKELNIPVIALSQLSRQPERRGKDRRPQLADLRESGNLEQDADMVAFIYREEVYDPENPEVEGIAEFIVAKHRNGALGRIRLAFLKETTTFKSLARGDLEPPSDVF